MKKLLVIVFVLFFMASIGGFAQERPEAPGVGETTEEEEGKEAEEKTKKEKPKKEKVPLEVDIGNMLIIKGGVNYRLTELPYGSIGFGFEFPLGNALLFGTGITMVRTKVLSDASYTNATSVEGGEINYLDVMFSLRTFIRKNWWFSGGFIYEAFLNGYYIDNDGTNTLHVALSKTDEPNNLGLHLATGLYSMVRENVYVLPGVSLRWNLPTTGAFSFAISDIALGIDFGIGIRM